MCNDKFSDLEEDCVILASQVSGEVGSFFANAKQTRLLGSTALSGAALALIVSTSTVFLPGYALAQSIWDGDTSNVWSLATNWSTPAAPGSGDDAVINNGALVNQPVVTAAATVGTVNLSAGSLTVNAGLDIESTLTQSSGLLNGSAVVTVAGAFTHSGGATGGTVDLNVGSFTQSGGAQIGANTTVTSAGPQSLQGGTIAGTLNGAGAVTVSGGLTNMTGQITAAALVTVTGGGTISATGLYTAPAYVTATTAATVKATAVADPTKFATATVTLRNPGIYWKPIEMLLRR